MSDRSRIEIINADIKKMDDSINDTVDKISLLQKEASDLMIKIIEEDNLLKNTLWEINVSYKISLDYSGDKNDAFFKPITDLCNGAWHTWLDMEDGIQLRFDEDTVSLHFEETKQIVSFANKHQIKITGSNVTDKLHTLKREVSTLEQLVHQFSIKN